MIDLAVVEHQVKKLAGLDRYPRSPEGLQSLIDAFRATFHSELELVQSVQDILRDRTECPKPHHIYQMKPRGTHEWKGHRCHICYDTGQTYEPHLVTFGERGRTQERLTEEQRKELPALDSNQEVYDLPVPCACRQQRQFKESA